MKPLCVLSLLLGLSLGAATTLTAQASTKADSVVADSTAAAATDREKAVDALLAAHSFTVPHSPAFSLFTEAPGKVLHVGAGADLEQTAATFISGGRIATGAAFDVRPFAAHGGSLTGYRRSPARRIAWRTVLGVGTAPSGDNVLLSAGLRLPLIDKGDVRADSANLRKLEQAFLDALSRQQPPFGASTAALKTRFDSASAHADSARTELVRQMWNRFKLDAGFAGALSFSDGRWRHGHAHSGGLWVGAALPAGRDAQVTAIAKSLWMKGDSIGAQVREDNLGARLDWFPVHWLTIAAEGTAVWAGYKRGEMAGATEHDGSWVSTVAFAEFRLPFGGGWLGVAYGGDLGRSGTEATRFAIQYAHYSDRKVQSPY